MKITVIGSGYVGLVSGACFSEFGFQVTCIDKDAAKIDALKDGIIPIYEPGLDDLVARNMAAGRLGFDTDLQAAVAEADAIFIAVGTSTSASGLVSCRTRPCCCRRSQDIAL